MTIQRISPTLPLSALLLWAGCGPAPAASEPVQHREQQATGPLSTEPARTLLANVSTTTQQEQLALDHLVVAQLGPGEPMVAVMLAAGRERRYVSVFEVDPSVRAEEMPGYRFVLGVDFEYHGRWWLSPEAPTFGDIDGDGRDEVLITFNTLLADRSTQTAIVLTKRDGSWRALEHPSVLPVLTSSFDAIGFTGSIRQDDKLAVMNATSPKTTPLRLHGLHTGGGWQLVARPDGSAGLLATAAMTNPEGLPRPSRVALTMFRLGDEGYVLDPTWNSARPYLTSGPVSLREFDLEQIVADGFTEPK